MKRAAVRAQRMFNEIEMILADWREDKDRAERFPPIPDIVIALNKRGWKRTRGGDLTYRTVLGVIERFDHEWWQLASAGEARVAASLGMQLFNRFVLKEDFEEFQAGDQGMLVWPRRDGNMLVGMGVIPEGTFREFILPMALIDVID